jgi:hypothetical protein
MTRWSFAILLVALAALACQENSPGAAAPLGDLSDAGSDPNERLGPPPARGGW